MIADTFDLIVKGATVVNHDGTGERDIGIRGGRIAAIGNLAQVEGRRSDRRQGPHRAAGRDRHAGAFPRARPRAQGGPGNRQPRRGHGRGDGGVRDAQHQAADDVAPRRWPTRWPAPATACSATSPSTSAARARTSRISRRWSGWRARPASRCSWAPPPATCWWTTSPRSIGIIAKISRRAAFHAEDEARLQGARASAQGRRSLVPSRLARRAGGADRHPAAGAARREARQARARAARVDGGGDGVPQPSTRTGQASR